MKKKIIIIALSVILVVGTICITGWISYNDAMELEIDRIPVPIEKIPEILDRYITKDEVAEILGSTGYYCSTHFEYLIDIGEMSVQEAIDYLKTECGFRLVTNPLPDDWVYGTPFLVSENPEDYPDGLLLYIGYDRLSDHFTEICIHNIDGEKRAYLKDPENHKFMKEYYKENHIMY